MGVKAVDHWTLGHFIMGMLTTMSVCPHHPGVGILLGNMVHAYLEELEKDYQKGVLVESQRNHIGDYVAFAIGSFVGIFFTFITIKYPILRWMILIFVAWWAVQEWGREKWPNSWYFDGAGSPFHWFGTVTALVKNEKK